LSSLPTSQTLSRHIHIVTSNKIKINTNMK